MKNIQFKKIFLLVYVQIKQFIVSGIDIAKTTFNLKYRSYILFDELMLLLEKMKQQQNIVEEVVVHQRFSPVKLVIKARNQILYFCEYINPLTAENERLAEQYIQKIKDLFPNCTVRCVDTKRTPVFHTHMLHASH